MKVDKFFIQKVKAVLSYLHIYYGKDCCEFAPVRFNKTTNKVEYYAGNGQWVETP